MPYWVYASGNRSRVDEIRCGEGIRQVFSQLKYISTGDEHLEEFDSSVTLYRNY